MSERKTKMQTWVDYRVRVITSDQRILVGNFMAFDKYMNMVLGDAEEFRKIVTKGEEKEVKRVTSLTAEAPPAYLVKNTQMQAGPGRAAVAGRGAGIPQQKAGLTAPVRGVGGPAPANMQPRGLRPPGMPY
eukprot:g3738.t1